MSSLFILELDTAAPEVEWGAVGGTDPGALFQIAYTADEPAIVAATLTDAGGQVVELDILPDRLEAILPVDAFGGWATIRVTVRDDLDNEAERTTTVLLTGHPPPEADKPPAGPPMGARPQRRHVDRRTVFTRSAATASSADTTTVSATDTTTAGGGSTTTIVSRPGERGRLVGRRSPRDYGPAAAAASSRENIATTVAGTPSAGGGRSTSTVRRADGPDEELAAVLLLL